jgi:hypothetical protein
MKGRSILKFPTMMALEREKGVRRAEKINQGSFRQANRGVGGAGSAHPGHSENE